MLLIAYVLVGGPTGVAYPVDAVGLDYLVARMSRPSVTAIGVYEGAMSGVGTEASSVRRKKRVLDGLLSYNEPSGQAC